MTLRFHRYRPVPARLLLNTEAVPHIDCRFSWHQHHLINDKFDFSWPVLATVFYHCWIRDAGNGFIKVYPPSKRRGSWNFDRLEPSEIPETEPWTTPIKRPGCLFLIYSGFNNEIADNNRIWSATKESFFNPCSITLLHPTLPLLFRLVFD